MMKDIECVKFYNTDESTLNNATQKYIKQYNTKYQSNCKNYGNTKEKTEYRNLHTVN